MADDYYKILGVSRSASAEEIQKAYRKLATKFHPDRHADAEDREQKRAKEQFQKVQQAYDVISDEEKRGLYDQLGPDFERMGGGGNPFGGGGRGQNPFGGGEVDFSQIFGGGGPGGPAGGGGGMEDLFRHFGGGGGRPGAGTAQRPPQQPQAVEQEITVPFSTAIKGGQHQVSFQRRDGKVDNLTVKIPAGIASGKKIRLRGQGNSAGPGVPRGDLMIVVKVAGHPSFRRSAMNLVVTVPISVVEAVNGAKIDLPTPHGTVVLSVPAGTSSGKSLRLKGMGVRQGDQSGDLIANLEIVMPDQISDADRELIAQLGTAWTEVTQRDQIVW